MDVNGERGGSVELFLGERFWVGGTVFGPRSMMDWLLRWSKELYGKNHPRTQDVLKLKNLMDGVCRRSCESEFAVSLLADEAAVEVTGYIESVERVMKKLEGMVKEGTELMDEVAAEKGSEGLRAGRFCEGFLSGSRDGVTAGKIVEMLETWNFRYEANVLLVVNSLCLYGTQHGKYNRKENCSRCGYEFRL